MTLGTPYIYIQGPVLVTGTFVIFLPPSRISQLFLSEVKRKLSSTVNFPLMSLILFLQWHIYWCMAASVM